MFKPLLQTIIRAGATGPVGPVLAGSIFVRKRGCDNCVLTLALYIVNVSARACTNGIHTLIDLECSRAGTWSRRGRVDQIANLALPKKMCFRRAW